MRDLVTNILECSSAPDNWEHALDTFNETFQISASTMYSVHEFQSNRLNFTWSSFYKAPVISRELDIMTTGGDGDDTPGYLSLFNNPAQKFYNEMQLFQVEAYADLPPSKVRDLTESWGFKMRIAAAFNKNGPWLDGIFCQCRTEAEWRGIVADKRMDICLPIMANTISLGRTLQALRMRYHASLSILDALGLAVLLVDATGNVIEHNKEAQRIIDMEDGLSLSASKRIKLCSPDKTNELEAMMNTANGLLIGNIGTVNTLMACERPSSLKNYDARRKAISFVSQRRQEFL